MYRRLLAVGLALLTLTACGGQAGTSAGAQDSKTDIEKALDSCNSALETWASVGDNGDTLTIDGQGKDDAADTKASITSEACILSALDVTDAIVSEMDSTTAMMGRQEGTWGKHSISWTYHPDNGLDFIVTTK